MKNIIIFLFVLSISASGCSSGVYNKMDSSAPTFGPILIGMSRAEAEVHLGEPLIVTDIHDGLYSTIYEYELEKTPLDTITTDIMDFLTAGMWIYVVSPVERHAGSRHLIGIIYEMEDQYAKNDRVVEVTEKVKIINNRVENNG